MGAERRMIACSLLVAMLPALSLGVIALLGITVDPVLCVGLSSACLLSLGITSYLCSQLSLDPVVHEPRTAEESAIEGLQRIRSLSDDSSTLIWISDAKGEFVHLNKAWMDFTGSSDVGQDWILAVHPDDRAGFQSRYEENFKARSPFTIDFRLSNHLSEWRDMITMGVPRIGSDGTFLGYVGSCLDYTDRTQASKQLDRINLILTMVSQLQSEMMGAEKDNELFDRLLSTLLDISQSEYGFIGEILVGQNDQPYLKTHSITNIAWNDETEKFYEENAPNGLEFYNLETLFGHVIRSGEVVLANEPKLHPRSSGVPQGHPSLDAFLGIPLHIGSTMVGMVGLANRPGGYDLQSLDELKPILATISKLIEGHRARKEKEAAEVELQRYAEELERSNNELDEFAYVASHDLKAPLRAIQDLAGWISEDCQELLPEDSREDLELLQQRARRMERLLEDLLEYSRAGRLNDKTEIIETNELLEDVIDFIAPPDDFTVDVVGHMPTVELPRPPIEKIFRNLISNAIKHHHQSRGQIHVHSHEIDDHFIEFTVVDDGPGIPLDFQEQVFQMFRTLKPRDQVEGSGMGLAMVKKTVEGLGGEIVLESEEGKGCVFRLRLPRNMESTHLGTE